MSIQKTQAVKSSMLSTARRQYVIKQKPHAYQKQEVRISKKRKKKKVKQSWVAKGYISHEAEKWEKANVERRQERASEGCEES